MNEATHKQFARNCLCVALLFSANPAFADNPICNDYRNFSANARIQRGNNSDIDLVAVDRPLQPPITYQRTNRSIHEGDYYNYPLNRYYPMHMLDPENLRGKRVLDAGTGDGAFVEELHEANIDVVGIDIVLADHQKSRPDLFLERDIRHTQLPADNFDIIYSTYAVLTYEGGDAAVVRDTLREFNRILKIGGVARLGPVDNWANTALRPDLKIFEQQAREAGFEITWRGSTEASPKMHKMFELRKVR